MSDARSQGPGDKRQKALVRERFTRSADAFVNLAIPYRTRDVETIERMAAPQTGDVGIDLACGPGTFTLPLAQRARRVIGFDLTPAFLERARRRATEEGISNLSWMCGDATALPFRDASFDFATCGFSFHHMSEPAWALAELARVLRPGGRLAVVDLFIPDGADPETHNGVERARDASHTHTLRRSDFAGAIQAAGFRVRATQALERPRLFTEWQRIAGWNPEDLAARESRRLMLATLASDAGGFHPRLIAAEGSAEPDIEFIQSCMFVAAAKS